MATLKLKTLHCHRKQDVTGNDEPQIKLNSVAVWNDVVAKGGSVPIGVNFEFEDYVSVIAEEMNNTKPKQIGPAVIVRESGNPPLLTFKTAGAWYTVEFEVAA